VAAICGGLDAPGAVDGAAGLEVTLDVGFVVALGVVVDAALELVFDRPIELVVDAFDVPLGLGADPALVADAGPGIAVSIEVAGDTAGGVAGAALAVVTRSQRSPAPIITTGSFGLRSSTSPRSTTTDVSCASEATT
jgi:hypothetical protein